MITVTFEDLSRAVQGLPVPCADVSRPFWKVPLPEPVPLAFRPEDSSQTNSTRILEFQLKGGMHDNGLLKSLKFSWQLVTPIILVVEPKPPQN